jgi:uracil DNA glycosylase
MKINLNVLPKIEQNWSISKIIKECPPSSWVSAFNDAKEELEHISNKLDVEKVFGDYFPKKVDLFNAFKFCKLEDVKVIILKNEPYPTKDIGLAYSVGRNDEIPPVLYNIYQELKREYIDFKIPQHGDLRFWALQGVLLLHKSLTCSTKKSHAKYELWMGMHNRIFMGRCASNGIYVA